MKKTIYSFIILMIFGMLLQAQGDRNDPATVVKNTCSKCHGDHMEKRAFDASHIVNKMDVATIKQALEDYKVGKRNHEGFGFSMQQTIKDYSEKDIDALARYIPTLDKDNTAIDPAEIIKSKCSNCHGDRMQRRALDISSIVNSMSTKDIKDHLEGYKAGTLDQYGFGYSMQQILQPLSDKDIDALSKYIPTLKKK